MGNADPAKRRVRSTHEKKNEKLLQFDLTNIETSSNQETQDVFKTQG